MSSITMGKGKELSNEKRQMVVDLHKSSNGYKKKNVFKVRDKVYPGLTLHRQACPVGLFA